MHGKLYKISEEASGGPNVKVYVSFSDHSIFFPILIDWRKILVIKVAYLFVIFVFYNNIFVFYNNSGGKYEN